MATHHTVVSGCSMTIIGLAIRFDGRACTGTCGSFDRFMTTGRDLSDVRTGTLGDGCGLLSHGGMGDSRRGMTGIGGAHSTLE